MVVGDVLQAEVLLGGEHAGGNADPNHEGVSLLLPLGLARAAIVPGVLLVGPVKLEQRRVVPAEVARVGRERLRDGTAEVAARFLGDFDFGLSLASHLVPLTSRESRVANPGASSQAKRGTWVMSPGTLRLGPSIAQDDEISGLATLDFSNCDPRPETHGSPCSPHSNFSVPAQRPARE